MRKIGVICAMRKELELMTGEFAGRDNVFCRLSGIGKVNAAVAAERLIAEYRPDCILSIGVAGTFSDDLECGDAVIVSRTAYHDVWSGDKYAMGQVAGLPLFFESDRELVESAVRSLPEARVGLLCTGDQFYISPEEDARQKALFPDALAVDMEGAAVAQTAYLHGVPFLALKIISDTHNDGRQKEHYEEFWNGLALKSFNIVHTVIDNL